MTNVADAAVSAAGTAAGTAMEPKTGIKQVAGAVPLRTVALLAAVAVGAFIAGRWSAHR